MHLQFLRSPNQADPNVVKFLNYLDRDFFFNLLSEPISLVCFILTAYALYKLAKAREIPKPWLAWIPFGSYWILGYLSDQYQGRMRKKMTTKRIILVILEVVLIATLVLFLNLPSGPQDGISQYIAVRSAVICLVGVLIVVIIRAVVTYIALYDVYRSCDPDRATLYLVLSILLGPAQAVCLFLCRNKHDGIDMPEGYDDEEYA